MNKQGAICFLLASEIMMSGSIMKNLNANMNISNQSNKAIIKNNSFVNEKNLPILKIKNVNFKPVDTVSVEQEEETPYYISEIPLSRELQKYTYDLCKEKHISYELILAVMWKESDFQTNLINVNRNDTKDYGLLQINTSNLKWLQEKCGITDVMDDKNNIRSGIELVSYCVSKYGENDGLIAYNMGESGMKKLKKKGYASTYYSRTILSKKAEFENLKKDK